MSKKAVPASGKCKDIHSALLMVCPDFINKIEYYAPFDRKTLRFKLYSGEVYLFEFTSLNDWSLQTERHFFNSQSKHASI